MEIALVFLGGFSFVFTVIHIAIAIKDSKSFEDTTDFSDVSDSRKSLLLAIYFGTTLLLVITALSYGSKRDGEGWLRGRREIEKKLIEIGTCRYKLNETTGVVELVTVK